VLPCDVASNRAQTHAPWSASKVQTALRCPRLFHYRYIDKVPEPEIMPETRIGKGIHAALEEALKGTELDVAIEHGRGDLDEESGLARYQTLSQNIAPFVERISDFRRRRGVKRELIEFSVAVREDFTPTSFFSGDAFFRGIFDAAYFFGDGQLAMVDHKSGSRYANMSITEQLEGYAVLATAQFRQIRRVWLGIHWVVDADVEWARPIATEEIEATLRPNVLANVEAAALAVADGPRANTSSWCERCSYRSVCAEGQRVRFDPVDEEEPPWM
jgi:RecB family exonuclease